MAKIIPFPHTCTPECTKMYIHTPEGEILTTGRNPEVTIGLLGENLNG